MHVLDQNMIILSYDEDRAPVTGFPSFTAVFEPPLYKVDLQLLLRRSRLKRSIKQTKVQNQFAQFDSNFQYVLSF